MCPELSAWFWRVNAFEDFYVELNLHGGPKLRGGLLRACVEQVSRKARAAGLTA